jgi:hypothetical protein
MVRPCLQNPEENRLPCLTFLAKQNRGLASLKTLLWVGLLNCKRGIKQAAEAPPTAQPRPPLGHTHSAATPTPQTHLSPQSCPPPQCRPLPSPALIPAPAPPPCQSPLPSPAHLPCPQFYPHSQSRQSPPCSSVTPPTSQSRQSPPCSSVTPTSPTPPTSQSRPSPRLLLLLGSAPSQAPPTSPSSA